MADPNPTSLSVAEVRALADRLQARATSAFAVGSPSQQGDGLLAAAALVHLTLELQALRSEVRRIAAIEKRSKPYSMHFRGRTAAASSSSGSTTDTKARGGSRRPSPGMGALDAPKMQRIF